MLFCCLFEPLKELLSKTVRKGQLEVWWTHFINFTNIWSRFHVVSPTINAITRKRLPRQTQTAKLINVETSNYVKTLTCMEKGKPKEMLGSLPICLLWWQKLSLIKHFSGKFSSDSSAADNWRKFLNFPTGFEGSNLVFMLSIYFLEHTLLVGGGENLLKCEPFELTFSH